MYQMSAMVNTSMDFMFVLDSGSMVLPSSRALDENHKFMEILPVALGM